MCFQRHRALLRACLIATAGAVFTFACFPAGSLCENDVVDEHRSPGNRSKVVVFERSCGATTGFSTQASILKADDLLGNRPGNVLVIDSDRGRVPSATGKGPDVRVRWTTEHEVDISHHELARVFRAEARHLDVDVTIHKYR